MMDGIYMSDRTFFKQTPAELTFFFSFATLALLVRWPFSYFFQGLANTVENTEYFSLPDFPESRSSSSEYQSDSNIDVNQDSGNYSLPPSSSNSSHGTSPPRKISYGKNPAPLPPKLSPNKALVIYDYNKKTPTEVSLEKSQVVQILDSKPGAEWWRVKDDFGRIGYYPSHYLRMIWWKSFAQLLILLIFYIEYRLLLNSFYFYGIQEPSLQTEWWLNILNVRCTYIN